MIRNDKKNKGRRREEKEEDGENSKLTETSIRLHENRWLASVMSNSTKIGNFVKTRRFNNVGDFFVRVDLQKKRPQISSLNTVCHMTSTNSRPCKTNAPLHFKKKSLKRKKPCPTPHLWQQVPLVQIKVWWTNRSNYTDNDSNETVLALKVPLNGRRFT